MKLHLVAEGLLFLGALMAMLDNRRLRRRIHVDRLAREAEDMLGPARIGDLDMPDPYDPRWKEAIDDFGTLAKPRKEHVLKLDTISVVDTGHVFIGAGAHVENSQHYGQRVIKAYRQRLINAAKGT